MLNALIKGSLFFLFFNERFSSLLGWAIDLLRFYSIFFFNSTTDFISTKYYSLTFEHMLIPNFKSMNFQ